MKKQVSSDTIAARSGSEHGKHYGLSNTPVHRVSAVRFPSYQAYLDRKKNWTDFSREELYYGSVESPSVYDLEHALAELEGGFRSAVVSTGFAAITSTLLTLCSSGDHIVVTDNAYGVTRAFCDSHLKRHGVTTSYFDQTNLGSLEKLIQNNTKLILLEVPGSLTFEMCDIDVVVEIANKHKIKTVLDNTWASPICFSPFERGIDISVHSLSKLVAGHSDLLLGSITCGEEDYVALKTSAGLYGFCASPDDCYLALRGLRTLPVRLERYQRSGLRVAEWLLGREEVSRVLYPALESDPGFELWQRYFSGAPGVFSFLLKPGYTQSQLARFMDSLDLLSMGFGWGGVESQIMPVDPSESRTARPWQEEGFLIRIHVGLENVEDILADLERGFAGLLTSNPSEIKPVKKNA